MKAGKVIRNVLIGIIGLLLMLLVAIQILLRPKVLTGIVNSLAAEYVDGDVNFRQVKAHAIKSFPFLNVDIEDFSITYPHQRYARFDSVYTENTRRRFSLLKAGNQRDGDIDTLASFRQLSVSLDYMALINRKTIYVRRLELSRPRIFAHAYDSTAANWDILLLGSDEPKDTTVKESKSLPGIVLKKIALTERPLIIYTCPADTIMGMFSMRNMTLDGKLETARLFRSRTQLGIDSLMISGRLAADTVAFRLQRLRAGIRERNITLDADAQASLFTNTHGRIRVPIHLDTDVSLPKCKEGELEALIKSLNLSLSALNLKGQGRIFRQKDGLLDMDLEAGIKDCPLGEMAREFQDNIPALKGLPTNAIQISLSARAKGQYGHGQKPGVTVKVDKLLADVYGAHLLASGSIKNALGEDPHLSLDASLKARVDSLTEVFTKDMGILGTGTLDARVAGKARLSQLNLSRIGNANLSADIQAHDLDIRGDSLSALIPRLSVGLETKGNQIDRNLKQGARVLALKADADTLDVTLGTMFVRSGPLQLLAQNSADILKRSKDLSSLMGILKVSTLRLRDSDGMGISLRDNTETFRIEPAGEGRPTPRLTLRSRSGGVRARLDANLLGLRNLDFDLSATRHVRRQPNAERMNRLLDSLQRVYPDIPRDSLLRKSREERLLQESKDVFAGSDVKISLSQAAQDYARNWDIEGNLSLGSGRAMLPAFPLPTSVSNIQGSFDNDTLDLKNITLQAGASDLSAQARLTGLRRAMLGRGRSLLKLKAGVTSNYIDANELLRGYAYSTTYKPAKALEDASDEAVEEAVDLAQLPDSTDEATVSKLLVIPSNLEIDFSLEAAGIKYDSLEVSWAAADVAMRQRTLQITNALAASNMGDIYFEGFYSTHSKEDIRAGFDLNLVHITAEKVITLFPAIDTLIPLLTTFQGDLDCELAATTNIDTLMHVILPSVDGVMRITGKDLTLKESEELSKITKLLMFRNKNEARIDNMAVTGIVQNNILEIFPFVLDVDRYLLAASGTQHLSKQFDYHVSVIKSPLILKFGLNAWGEDFDNIHYGLGKAKYTNANVPVYTKQLDNAQFNLVAAIHNIFELGVEKAMEENRTSQYFGTMADASTHPAEGGADVSQDSLLGMERFFTDVMEQTTVRREALKEEVIRLEAEAAKQQ